MPYIKPPVRKVLDDLPLSDVGRLCTSPGDLNYAFSVIAREYLTRMPMNYQAINDVLGALSGASLEVYRRVVANYEDNKIAENGDVY